MRQTPLDVCVEAVDIKLQTGLSPCELLQQRTDLLEALKNITEWVNEVGNCTCDDALHDFIVNTVEGTIVSAKAAIARATGQEGD